MGVTVCGRKMLGHWETYGTLTQNITFRGLMCIKIETLMSEYERDAETDVFRTGDTAHKYSNKNSHHIQITIGYM